MKTPFLITGIALLVVGAAFGIYGFLQTESNYQTSIIAGGWIVAVAGAVLIGIGAIMKEPKLESIFWLDTVEGRPFQENIVLRVEKVHSQSQSI